jgi:hypothetical protein
MEKENRVANTCKSKNSNKNRDGTNGIKQIENNLRCLKIGIST